MIRSQWTRWTWLGVSLVASACGDDTATGGNGAGGNEATGGAGNQGGMPANGGHASVGGGEIGGGEIGGGEVGGGNGWPTPPPNYCDLCVLGAGSPLVDPAMNEISGVVASPTHEDTFYVHNDSGDTPRFFAIDGSGASLATFTLEGATHLDYEDIGRGPCETGQCIYVGDIGDNAEARAFYVLWRVPEPEALTTQTVTPTELRWSYPDGSHNSETLLVHPITGEIVLVQKVDGPSGIYRAPSDWPEGETVTLTHEGELAPPEGSQLFTGGDVHPQGHGVLLRTYSHVLFYPASGPESPLAETLQGTPCTVPSAAENQGEAVGWNQEGTGYVTISEGAGSDVVHVTCEG